MYIDCMAKLSIKYYSYVVVMVSTWMVYWLINTTAFKLDVILVSTLMSFSHIKDDVLSKKTDFTVDLIWWAC